VTNSKTVRMLVWITLAVPALSVGVEQPLANDGKYGLYAKSIEQVLRLSPDEIDLGTATLIVSEQWSDIVQGRRYLLDLDEMAYEIRRRIEGRRSRNPLDVVAIINEYLFKELGYKSVKEANDKNDLFLHKVMDNKKGYCLSLSVLYLALGERLGLPLHGVVVPGHFFVRYDDGRVRFNIETTNAGARAPDEYYIEKFDVPEYSDSIYLKNLNKLQTLGCFFNNLGNVYLDIGDLEMAQLALERAVEINPDLAETRTNLGNVYLRLGQTDQAIRQYKAALAINSEQATTHNNLGNAYMKRQWYADAILEYHNAIELDPNFIDGYKNLALAYCRQEAFGQAISQLKQALAIKPEDAGLYYSLGQVYYEMGDYTRSVACHKRALQIKPDMAEAYVGIAQCYGEIGMVDEQIEAYKKALATKPDFIQALADLGNVYFSSGRYDKAIKLYDKAIQLGGDNGALYYNLGSAYSNKRDYERAILYYNKALETDGQMTEAHPRLAFAYYQTRQYQRAWEHLRRAQELGVPVDQTLLKAIERKRK